MFVFISIEMFMARYEQGDFIFKHINTDITADIG